MSEEIFMLVILKHLVDRTPLLPVQRALLSVDADDLGWSDIAAVLRSDAMWAIVCARSGRISMQRHPSPVHGQGQGELWLVADPDRVGGLLALAVLCWEDAVREVRR